MIKLVISYLSFFYLLYFISYVLLFHCITLRSYHNVQYLGVEDKTLRFCHDTHQQSPWLCEINSFINKRKNTKSL